MGAAWRDVAGGEAVRVAGYGVYSMTNRQQEFINKLVSLLGEYNVEIFYTTDDDGLHLSMDGEEFYVSWLTNETALYDERCKAR